MSAESLRHEANSEAQTSTYTTEREAAIHGGDVLVTSRQEGKTETLVAWVREGQQVYQYPGWDRVLLVSSIREADRVRRQYNLDYRQVFTYAEWRSGRFPDPRPLVAVDDADWLIADYLRHRPSVVAMTGVPQTVQSIRDDNQTGDNA